MINTNYSNSNLSSINEETKEIPLTNSKKRGTENLESTDMQEKTSSENIPNKRKMTEEEMVKLFRSKCPSIRILCIRNHFTEGGAYVVLTGESIKGTLSEITNTAQKTLNRTEPQFIPKDGGIICPTRDDEVFVTLLDEDKNVLFESRRIQLFSDRKAILKLIDKHKQGNMEDIEVTLSNLIV